MRLTLRCLTYAMAAIESGMDEFALAMMRQEKLFELEVTALRKQLRFTRQAASALLDRMIDEGKG
jgi:hypothetical protein